MKMKLCHHFEHVSIFFLYLDNRCSCLIVLSTGKTDKTVCFRRKKAALQEFLKGQPALKTCLMRSVARHRSDLISNKWKHVMANLLYPLYFLTMIPHHPCYMWQPIKVLNDFIFTHQEKGGLFSGLIKKKETSAEVTGHSITICSDFYSDFRCQLNELWVYVWL